MHAMACLPSLQGAPFCFYSTFGGESILCFDLRTRRCLYELATGNTCVHSLQVNQRLLPLLPVYIAVAQHLLLGVLLGSACCIGWC